MLLHATTSQTDAISLTSAQRIVSVLSHVDTLPAKQAFIELSEWDDELGQLASLELARKEPQKAGTRN